MLKENHSRTQADETNAESMKKLSLWRSSPLASRVVFLFAVFFIFASCGFAIDTIDMGRQPPIRLAISVVLFSLFAVSYATSGIVLRARFWKAFIPLFLLQNLCMAIVGHFFPESAVYNAIQTAHMQSRFAFDGSAVMISVVLGYTGFVYVTVSEGRRYLRTQTEKASLESEMAAAREVQRFMVSEDLPPILGYDLEAVYRPAAEVGGDFFQVIPLKSGRTLVVIGDVSGKGLRAAMIVSMIVGILRTVSGLTEEPAEILAEMNRGLCGRMHGGFATCLAVRLDGGGRLMIANAGHLPPYLNGVEFPFAGSLPLGLTETAGYDQTNLDILYGDRVTLLTDGIAEAQNPQRELFGFPRVESLLRQGTAATIVANAAQDFGQNDDLTVICLARQSVSSPTGFQHAQSGLTALPPLPSN